MQNRSRGLSLVLTGLIVVGVLAGLVGAGRRYSVEARNRRVEIALEWNEVFSLAQTDPQRRPLPAILAQLKQAGVTTLVISEDSLASLEVAGVLHARHARTNWTSVEAVNPAILARIRAALTDRGIPVEDGSTPPAEPQSAAGRTVFYLPYIGIQSRGFRVPAEYATLRTLGLGLPPEATLAAQNAGLRIAGRISNFPGVTPESAGRVLRRLSEQGANTVIFLGDDVLGYRGIEKQVAAHLQTQQATSGGSGAALPPGLTYGAVEFGKQKGDEKIAAALKGDYVRVHSIQAAEMSQMSADDAVDRFARAARERNIRFCYARLLTFAGNDPVAENAEYLKRIQEGMQRGGTWTGGGLALGAARPLDETGTPRLAFALIALGAAAGTVWMLRLFCPLPAKGEGLLLFGLCVLCGGLAAGGGEMGRRLVALLAGIVYPAAACLRVLPRAAAPESGAESPRAQPGLPRGACLRIAGGGLMLASGITLLGIAHVVGLLATRPFMLRASQFLGIKAQHALPLLIVAAAVVLGGAAMQGETWQGFRARAEERMRALWNEPARIGLLILGVVALAALLLIVARTGNEPGVGVSGIEMKFRALLDRALPARPRTKEFLLGHPLLLLGLAWWWRGRRRAALPCLVLGSIGQVSLLNTFCHIHTPLIVSLWRGGIGLLLGALIGAGLFLLLERFLPPVAASEQRPDEAAWGARRRGVASPDVSCYHEL